LFVASAGNDGLNNDDTRFSRFPASHRLPNLISVGSSDQDDRRSIFSNIQSSHYGRNTVDVFAPGSDIYSPVIWRQFVFEHGLTVMWPARRYRNSSGTSMSAPFVAGVAALMLSVNPDITSSEKRSLIIGSVDNVSCYYIRNRSVSGGRLNAYRAVRMALDSTNRWQQPTFTSSTLAAHGTITASGVYRNEAPWRAFNGTMNGGSGGNGDNWSVNSQTGWLELRLDYHIVVHAIEIWGNTSAGNNRTRNAHFTGSGNVPLGSPFELENRNHAYQFVHIRGIRTNVIRLNITSSYGNWVGVSLIRIHATTEFFACGIGTSQNPFLISNAEHLNNIRHAPNSHFRLTSNIDLRDLGGRWTPIPDFHGTLDGNFHTIRGLNIGTTVTQTGADAGLFARNHGLIHRLNITNSNIHFTPHHLNPWSNIGVVAGVNHGRIEHTHVTFSHIEVHRANSSIGGIAGRNFGLILYCSIRNTHIQGNGDMGGITGTNYRGGRVERCSAYHMEIHYWMSYHRRAVGGIVGWHYRSLMYRNRVLHSNIRFIGQQGATQHAPPMGIMVGGVSSSTVLYNHGYRSHLHAGNLAQSQRTNFGQTAGWPWGGQVWGSSTIRAIPGVVV